MKFLATSKVDQNSTVVDPWTVVHFSMGLAAGLANISPPVALAGAVAYEFAEQVFERSEAGQSFFNVSGPEIPANAMVDVVVFAVGQYLGRLWNES